MRSALVPCCSQLEQLRVPSAPLLLLRNKFLKAYAQFGKPSVGDEALDHWPDRGLGRRLDQRLDERGGAGRKMVVGG